MPLLNGLDAAREILKICPRARAILLTMHTDDHYVLEAVRAGIKGYVVKTQASADLVDGMSEVLGGRMYLSPGISHAVVEAYLAKSEMPPDPLTSREREVLLLVGDAANGAEAVRLATETMPDVVVLDYGMPLMNGLAAAREIMVSCPRAKLILLTMHADDRYVLEAVRLGVKGYVVKSQAPTDLVRAIHEVLHGLMYLSPRVP